MTLLIWFVVSYFIGGIPTGILISRWVMGTDPRLHGSGSSGATNVSRILGKKWAAVVFAIDAVKGFVPAFFFPDLAGGDVGTEVSIVSAAGAILGHVFTPFAGFRGGKGVATGAGAMLALSPVVTGISFLMWALVFGLTRTVSLASICAVIALPIAAFAVPQAPIQVAWFALALCGFIIATHRGNIVRIVSRREKRIL